MKYSFLIVIGLLLTPACSGDADKIHLRTEKGKRHSTNAVSANRSLTVEIKGMMCEMGCGGSIRKELKSTGAVARVQFDFEEERAFNTSVISYDSTRISAADLIKRIQKMNDKQFVIGGFKVEALTSNASDSRTSGGNDESNVKMEESNFRLPNLLDILKDLIIY
jgi:copper chaperone CopZ